MSDYIYAVMNGDGIVENIVLADNADAVEVLRLLIPEAADILLTTDDTGPSYIGGDRVAGRFRMPSPYPSWVWNGNDWLWDAPVPYPQDGKGYTWDESLQEWVPIPPVGE